MRPAPPLKGLGLDGPGGRVPSSLQESGNEFSRRLANKTREGSTPHGRDAASAARGARQRRASRARFGVSRTRLDFLRDW